MGFLLLMPFYPSVWSEARCAVLLQSEEIQGFPKCFPLRVLGMRLFQGKKNLWTLFGCMPSETSTQQVGFRVQAGKDIPAQFTTISQTCTPTPQAAGCSVILTGYFFLKEIPWQETCMIWIDSTTDFIIYPLANWKEKEDNASLFQGICSWKAMWNYRISLKLHLIVNNVEQRETGLQDIRNFPVVALLTAAGFGKISSPGIPVFMPGLHSTSPFSARSWQAGRHSNPPSKMETNPRFYWSPWLFT